MFELVRICQDRSGFYPPKSQPDLPRLAQALQSNISLADLWLRGMAIGAASSGRTVQWPWLNLLPSPIRSCSSTSVGNWLMNIYEPWVHDHFMTSQGIACPIHTMSSPQLPIQQSQMLEQQVGYGGRGSIGSVDPSFFMIHGFTGDYIDRDTQWAIGATQHGPQADCLAWKNRFSIGSTFRWISCGTVTYSTVTYRPLLTRIRSQDSARLCGSMRCMWVTRCRILCRFGESWKFTEFRWIQINSFSHILMGDMGVRSMFYWAIGILPFKDGPWPRYVELQLILATLCHFLFWCFLAWGFYSSNLDTT